MLEKGAELLGRIKRAFGKQPLASLDRGQFSYTSEFKKRVSNSPFFEEADGEARNGYYQERMIIGRDTPINRGVYITNGQREAIVVDDRNSDRLNEVYAQLLRIQIKKVVQQNGHFGDGILNAVFDLTKEYIPYNLAATEQITSRYPKDQKVHLEVFIGNRAGVCRHQALLAGYLVEKVIKSGYLKGAVSVDRNIVPGKGGHAWVRYIDHQGIVYIVDPAQQYVGKLTDIKQGQEGAWFYKRPTDR